MNINDINEKIMKIKLEMKEIEKAKRLLDEEKKSESQLIENLSGLKKQLEKENLDVDKLEKISLSKFYHTIKGDVEDTMQKEKREAWRAKLKVDTANQELKDIRNRINKFSGKVSQYSHLKKEYNQCIEDKEKLIRNSNTEIKEQLDYIVNKQIEYTNNMKEINEAIVAGDNLFESLNEVEKHLHSAKNWGTYDIIGGGILSTAIKHGKLDNAAAQINRTQSYLSAFRTELADVGKSIENMNIDISSFLRFADYFFDGLFADISVQSKINDALNQVNITIKKVNNIIQDLKRNLKIENEKLKNIEKEYKEIISNA